MHDYEKDKHNFEIQEATHYLFTHEIPYLAMTCVMVCGCCGCYLFLYFKNLRCNNRNTTRKISQISPICFINMGLICVISVIIYFLIFFFLLSFLTTITNDKTGKVAESVSNLTMENVNIPNLKQIKKELILLLAVEAVARAVKVELNQRLRAKMKKLMLPLEVIRNISILFILFYYVFHFSHL